MSINYETVLKRLRPGGDWGFVQIQSSGVDSRRSWDGDFAPDTNLEYDRFSYSSVVWNTTAVVTEQECADEWAVYEAEITDATVLENRRNHILNLFPMHDQFEALVEHFLGNSTKIQALAQAYNDAKTLYPKAGE
jgi:hypothetical protein